MTAYPVVNGRVRAPSLEVNVVEHCNLSCRACSHLSPVLPKRVVDPETLGGDLRVLSKRYHADVLRLVGGEPLLHPDLLGVIKAVRRSGVADRICVVTNGRLLPRVPRRFWKHVDIVEVSLYPGRSLTAEQQEQCRQQARRAKTKLDLAVRDDFRESYTEVGTDDQTLRREIFDTCKIVHAWRCHTVADGRFYRCPQSYFLPKIIDALAGSAERDSVRIDDTDTFTRDLLSLLESTEPLTACGYCLGTSGARFAHEQVKAVAFRGRQQRRAEELVIR